ncbi:helicase-associated domain-containing protein [Corynebacterium sp. LK2510]|uniref:helicase-associated domain-containing protein n=1 Tax=Corynebacterium sp. LK2510 TaxID=3110472 RepID=UPI0034CF0CEB
MSDFSAALGAMSDDELRTLIDARPDATFPTPPSLASFATRLTLPASLARAVRRLNAADIAVLETAGNAGAEFSPVPLTQLAELPLDVAGSVARLRAAGLAYGPDEALRLAPGATAALPPGWRILDHAPDGVEETIAALSPAQRKVLDTLAASGGVGVTSARSGPVVDLVDLGLLVRADESTVRLPRPVREVLRGQSPRVYPLRPPERGEADQVAVDTAATAQGLDAVRMQRQLLTLLVASPLALNRDGSVGVRARASLEKALGFDPALAVTVGESAGLIGRGVTDDGDVLAATRDGLHWLDLSQSDQWAILLAGWAASPWRTDLTEEQRLLSDETHAPDVRTARAAILRATGGDVVANLHFESPLVASGMSLRLIDAVGSEAALLGASALGFLATPVQVLLEGGDVAAETAQLVPAEVSTVIAQADMTILAPGPLSPAMAAVVESFADLESPGLASVYRVSEQSVRRALDAGRTAEELVTWLREHALGEVPQALSFVIEDAARNHGALRAGAVGSFVRSSDPALVTEAALRVSELRVVAPTVAVSELPLNQLLAQLRAAGLQPSAEDASGALLSAAPEPVLAPPTPSTLPRERSVPPEHADSVLAALRSGGDTEAGAGAAEQSSIPSTLRAAARARRRVRVGYVDKNGRGSTLTVLPLTVTAGQADVVDEATGKVVRIALPRVTKAVPAT